MPFVGISMHGPRDPFGMNAENRCHQCAAVIVTAVAGPAQYALLAGTTMLEQNSFRCVGVSACVQIGIDGLLAICR